jgi:hypothetical protein
MPLPSARFFRWGIAVPAVSLETEVAVLHTDVGNEVRASRPQNVEEELP